jgi:peptide/nickel transport system substrate-binding protein
MIVVILVIAIAAGFYLTRPGPEPSPTPMNKPPVALASSTETIAQVGDSLTFSATDSSDPDGEIATWEWDFGDGTTDSGETVTHEYDEPGRYIVVLTVTDDEGEETTNDDDLIFIDVSPETVIPTLDSPPIAKIAVDKDVVLVDENVTFDGQSSAGWYERRGTVTPIVGEIISWDWDFGDGTTGAGGEVTKSFDDAGNYAVMLTVKANTTGLTDSVVRTVRVTETEVIRPDIKNPDTFTFASSITSRSMDNVECTGASCRMSLVSTTEGLVWYPPGETEIKPRLAERYEISEDGLSYTFHLREGVTFWNGDEVTAEDVQYTFWRFMAMNLPASWCDRVNLPMTGIGTGERISDEIREQAVEVVDKYTVRFNLVEPTAPFIDTLALPICGIISKDYAIAHGSYEPGEDWLGIRDPNMQTGEALMGSGPYKLIQFVPNERTVLERYDGYWGEKAKIKRVMWLDILEWSTRQTMLVAGDIDATDGEASQVAVIEAYPGIEVKGMGHGMVEILYFGFDRDMELQPVGAKHRPDIMNDVHMRRGMAYAFPYDDYFEQAWLGKIDRAYSNIMPGFLGAYEFQKDIVYDPEKAAEEFKLAWNGTIWEEGFSLAFGYQPWMAEGGLIMGTLLEESLQKINPKFDLILEQQSWPTLLYYPLYPAWAQAGPDPMWYNYNYRSEYGLFAAYQKVGNEKLDEILDQALKEFDPEKRAALYKEATDMMAELDWMVHVDFPPTFFMYRDWVHNIDESWQMAWYVDSPFFATLEKR